MAHEHGAHECYCPSCGCTTTVDAYVQCNTQSCPCCGQPMRAVETGAYRETRVAQDGSGWNKVIVFGAFAGLGLLFLWGLSKKKAT